MQIEHQNLHALNEWCKQTKILHVWVSFYDTGEWAVRVLTNARGKAAPIRTCRGVSLEAVCAEILPKAQATFLEQKAALQRANDAYLKQNRRANAGITRDIEAMHHTSSDY